MIRPRPLSGADLVRCFSHHLLRLSLIVQTVPRLVRIAMPSPRPPGAAPAAVMGLGGVMGRRRPDRPGEPLAVLLGRLKNLNLIAERIPSLPRRSAPVQLDLGHSRVPALDQLQERF